MVTRESCDRIYFGGFMKKIVYSIILLALFIFIIPGTVHAQRYENIQSTEKKEKPAVGINFEDAQTPPNLHDEESIIRTINTILKKYTLLTTAVLALACMTSAVGFLLNLSRLGAAGTDPRARKTAIIGLYFCGLGTMLLGGLSVYFGLFFNTFK